MRATTLALAVFLGFSYVALSLLNAVRPMGMYFLPSSGNYLTDIAWCLGNLAVTISVFSVSFLLLTKTWVVSDVKKLVLLIVVASIPTQVLMLYFYGLNSRTIPSSFLPSSIVYIIFSVWQILTYGGVLNALGMALDRAFLPPLLLWYLAEILEKNLGLEH